MDNNQKKRLMIIGALTILLGVAAYEISYKVLLVAVVAIYSSLIVEILAAKARKEKYDFTSYFITPLVYSLIITVNISNHLWMVGVSVIFGVFFAKSLFGGQDKNIFNASALSLVFALLSFPAFLLNQGTQNAMGEIFVYTTLALAVLLIIFEVISPYTLISYLLTLIFMYGLIHSVTGSGLSITNVLFGTHMVFVGVFMATETVTSPKGALGQTIYGFIFGLLVWLINTQSSNDEFAAVYVVLLANAISPLIDQAIVHFKNKKRANEVVE